MDISNKTIEHLFYTQVKGMSLKSVWGIIEKKYEANNQDSKTKI